LFRGLGGGLMGGAGGEEECEGGGDYFFHDGPWNREPRMEQDIMGRRGEMGNGGWRREKVGVY
jgi:hypothetical protein